MITILQETATEGDVEAGVVLPLLTHEGYLGLSLTDIRSKASIPPRDIGKGTKRRIGYVPDFLVFKESLPLMVIEAKSPENDVVTAYTEARLYSAEINSGFGKDINPCSRILATNGIDVLFGYWDTEPLVTATVKQLAERAAELDVLRSAAAEGVLAEWAAHVSRKLRPPRFGRPFNRGAGASQIFSRIEPNTFAIDLAPTLNRYFASRSHEDDEAIYRYAYISSNEVTSYDRLLESHLRDRLAKSKVFTPVLTSKKDAKAVTKKITEFNSRKRTVGDIQLVTGGVGAGKSLFARR